MGCIRHRAGDAETRQRRVSNLCRGWNGRKGHTTTRRILAVILEVLLRLDPHREESRGRFLDLPAPHVIRVVGEGDRREDRDDRDRDHQFNQGETGWALHKNSLLLRLNDRELGESAANLPDEWPKSTYVRHLRRDSSGINSRSRA